MRSLVSVQVLLLAGLLTCSQGQAQPAAPRVPVHALPSGLAQKSGTPVVLGQAAVNPATGRVTATLTQTDATNIVDWKRFDIGRAAQLNIVQPSSTAVLLNKVEGGAFQNKTVIDGVLQANGRVYLYNPNGIVFGKGGEVNTAGLIASSLKFDENRVTGGLLRQGDGPVLGADPALGRTPGAVVVEGDAQSRAAIRIGGGGLALLAAPNVTNDGTVSAPDGQVILAAGGKVYLAAPNVGRTGTALRGLLVEVSNDDLPGLPGGSTPRTSENGPTGRVEVGRGNATLVGYAVNQKGLVSATTTVNLNGSIYLRAQDQAQVSNGTAAPTRAGPLVLGEGSVTEVQALASDTEKATSTAIFNRSQVTATGLGVEVQAGARIVAPGGNVALTAKRLYEEDPGGLAPDPRKDTAVRVDLAPGSVIDVSGSRGTTLAMESNVVEVELRGTELADNPVLRDSPLYASKVRVDVRQGTAIANISGYLEQRLFGLGELNAAGGTVSIAADAAVIQRAGSRIQVDGGWVDYAAGKVNTSQLRLGNSLVDIGSAKTGVAYSQVVNLPDSSVRTEAGYRQGASAGTVSLSAPIIVSQGELSGQATRGARQRDPSASGFPLGGSLQVGGQVRYEGTVQLGVDGTRALTAPAVGAAFQAADAEQSTLATRLDLDTGALAQAGFSRIGVQTRGDIVVAAPVTLPAAGQLRLDAALRGTLHDGEVNAAEGGHLSINAPIRMPSGTLNASAVGLDVAAGVVLDAAGRWTNDQAATGAPRDASGQPTGLLANRGGSVTLAATRLQLGDAVQIDVSAGASVSAAGRVSTGSAGAVSLRASTTELNAAGLAATRLVIGPGLQLRGHGFGSGGRLTLQGRDLVLGDVDTASLQGGELALSPSFFQQGGFTGYDIIAGRNLTVAAGVSVQPRAERWRLGASAGSVASGSMSSVATHWLAPLASASDVRASTSLSLRASANTGALPGSLRVLAGSRVDLDPGASLSVLSGGALQVEGTLHAPAGRITMSLLGTSGNLWFGAKAAVLAEGSSARLYTDGNGISSGELLDGGRILLGGATGTDRFGGTSLEPASGAIVMLPGAVFNVSGIGLGPQPVYLRSSTGQLSAVSGLGSQGGSIEIRSRTTLDLLGSFLGGGGSQGAKGGSLAISLDAPDAAVLDVMGRTALASRISGLRSTAFGDYVAEAGTGVVVADNINAGKFANLTLRSSDTLGFGLSKGSLTLSASAAMTLDAPTLLADSSLRAGVRDTLLREAKGELNSRDSSIRQAAIDALKAYDKARGNTSRDFDDLDLAAQDLAQARLATQRLDLDKAATLTLNAPAVQLGNANPDQSATAYPEPGAAAARSALAGNATLQVNAANIDLIGHSALQGFGAATLSATQDLRLTGIDWYDPNTPVGNPLVYDGTARGSFWMRGQLDLRSAQLYPTTLTDFTLAVEATADAGSGRLGFASSGQAPGPVLSVGGSLRALAPHIVQAGRVVAPLGQLRMGNTDPAVDPLVTADLTYRPGSVTSVAASGTLPLGVVTNGSVPTASSWTAQLPGGTEVALVQNPKSGQTTPQRALPSKAIVSSAGSVTVAPEATLDLSGGGQVVAYGFTPGRGGSQDVLANNKAGTAMTTFAILPGFTGKVAPVDGSFGADGGLAVGDAVWLSAQGQLAAGLYTLLPAHYALLPGGFSISVANGTRDMAANANQTLADGSYLVSGRLAQAGNGAQADRTLGFAVAPGKVVRQRSEFALYDADTYFADKARAAGVAAPDLPRDGGHVVFDGTDANANALRLDGAVRLAGAAKGLAGQADIAARRLEITSAPGIGAGGAVRLSADQLAALQARSLSLGAVRSETADGTRLDVRTSDLLLANDAAHALTAPDLVLAASDSLRIAPGASLQAQGQAGGRGDLLVAGGSAVLHATGSAGDGAIVRSAGGVVAAGATLDIGREARIGAIQALQIDATGRSSLAGSLAVGAGGALALAVPAIALGDALPAALAAQSVGLGNQALADWAALGSLTLNSRDAAMGLYGPVVLGGDHLQQLTLAGPGLSWVGDAGMARIQAGIVRLEGAVGGAAAADAAAGAGSLQVQAGRIDLAGGTFTLRQFADANLTATGDLRATGVGSTLSADAALRLDAARITAASGADARIHAGTTLTLAGADRAVAATSAPAGFGGRLAFDADTILSRAMVEATSGTVDLQATSRLVIDAGRISAAGQAVQFASATAYSPGGRIALQAPDLVLGAGATLDVSAAGAEAGSLSLTAVRGTSDGATLQLAGTLRGGAAAVEGQPAPVGGRFTLDTDSTTIGQAEAFAALNAQLNASVGGRATGFTGGRDFRFRQGDATLAGDATIVAGDVRIATDAGSITLRGGSRIDASGAKGGDIVLAARAQAGRDDSGQVRLLDSAGLLARGTATVSASGGGSAGQGGRVLLQTATADGALVSTPGGAASIVLAGGTIDVGASADGRGGSVTLRAPRTGSGEGQDVAVARLDTQVIGTAGPLVVEGTKVYTASSITGSADSSDGRNLSAAADGRLFTESSRFVDRAGSGLRTRLGVTDTALALRAGIEVQSAGDLLVSVNEFATLAADRGWNLGAWRFGGQPIGLTLRAAGDLRVVGSISDGFVKPTAAVQLRWAMPNWALGSGPSADLRLVAGADLAAARPDSVLANRGDLSIDFAARTPNVAAYPLIRAAGSSTLTPVNPNAPVTATDAPVALVRTGTGRIDLVAGRDVTLGLAKFYVSAVKDETEGYPVIFDRRVVDFGGNVSYDVSLYGATVYTAGQVPAAGAGPSITAPLNALNTHYGAAPNTLAAARFAGGGGAVSVVAGRDVTGPRNAAADWFYRQNGTPASEGDTSVRPVEPPTPAIPGEAVALPRVVPQLVNNWLFRQGRSTTDADGVTTFETLADGRTLNTAWWTRPDYFGQGIATLGGGDATVTAGRSVVDLSVSAASNAFVPTAGAALVERGGGDVAVHAGADVAGGVFYAQKGQAVLRAGGSLTTGLLEPADALGEGRNLAPVLALGDARASVTAGRQLQLASVFNPTMTEQSVNNQPLPLRQPVYQPGGAFDLANTTPEAQAIRQNYAQFSNFISYGPGTSVALNALGGDVLLSGSGAALAAAGQWEIPNQTRTSAVAADFQNLYALLPPTLQATAFSGDVATANGMALSPAGDGQLALLAAGSVQLHNGTGGSLRMLDAAPEAQSGIAAPRMLTRTDLGVLAGTSTALEAHAARGLHAGDSRAALVVARDGDVLGDPDAVASLSLPKAAQVVAGRDIVDLGLRLQHSGGADDVSLLQAGRDVLDTTQVRGGSAPSEVAVVVGGPGRLEVQAGRHIDLGNGSGLVTRGNLDNAYLPEGGAALRLTAGVRPADYTAFIAALAGTDPERSRLLAEALQQGRVALVDAAFFARLVEAGKAKDLKPFDALIASVFPDAATSAGGSISNFGSQLKTEQGGAITLFAPKGSVYAGLTVEPRPAKPASTLGIFTVRGGAVQSLVENDFLVNKGRVFTLGGGDITLVSQRGNIDAGRGSKTAASAPPPLITIDKDGNVQVDVANSISGSGIATLKTRPDVQPGDVFAIAPRGVFDAGDAGVRSSGSVLVVAPVVLNATNISAGGAISGAQVSVAAPSLGAVAVPTSAAARNDDVSRTAAGAGAAGSSLQLTVDTLGYGENDESDDSDDAKKKRKRANPS